MRNRRISIYLLIAILAMSMSTFAQSADKLPTINIKEYKLKNGLTVILHQDHSTPIVAVNMFYHVGSKNEAPGRTGFAHLFEHMIYQGSKNWGNSHRRRPQSGRAGSQGTRLDDGLFGHGRQRRLTVVR